MPPQTQETVTMAAPTLSVTRTPAGIVAPGTQIVFNVVAADADARSVDYTWQATDSAGAEVTVIETVVVSDPVDVEGTVSDPAGTATPPVQDAGNPVVWRSTV